MLCSLVIPVGNFAANRQNLGLIIASVPNLDFELVVVLDSAEEDGIDEITKLFAIHGNENFQLLRSECRNPGGSRNMGKVVAKGEWIAFCDSDDLPDFNGFSAAISEATNNDHVILASFNMKYQSQEVQTYFVSENASERLLEIAHKPGLWRWILRKKAIMNIDFQPLSMGEDQLFILEFLVRNPQFRSSQKIVYTYNSDVYGSLTSTKSRLKDLAEIITAGREKTIPDQLTRKLRNYLVFKQLLSLLKNGNLESKIFCIKTELKIMSVEVFFDQLRMLQFILTRRGNSKNA